MSALLQAIAERRMKARIGWLYSSRQLGRWVRAMDEHSVTRREPQPIKGGVTAGKCRHSVAVP